MHAPARRLVPAVLLGALLFAALGRGAAPDVVAVFPSAGTPVASTSTQISFRGAPPDRLGNVTVVGSKTGAHAGTLRAHSDGNGASFVAARPFRSGERVTVRAGVPLAGARNGAVSFTIAARTGQGRIRYTPDPGGTPAGVQRFRSQPGLVAPSLAVTRRAPGTAAGDIFLAAKAGPGPDGPMIADDQGRLVWFHKVPRGTSAFDFRVQQYESKPVLTWWQGRVFRPGEGRGTGLIYDSSYRRIAQVRAANGYTADFHEFELTPNGTALLLAYVPVRWNLARSHGSRHGIALDGVVQEVDVKTGLVEFEWHSLGQVGVEESYLRAPRHSNEAFDYFHVNSVDVESDGNLLVSARNTHAVYEIDRTTGGVLWRLGGKRSSFRMGAGSTFVAQHDANRAPDGTITIFDNAAPPVTGRPSRAVALALDESGRTASLARTYVHSPRVIAESQGSIQQLPNGNALVGWGGSSPYVSEYTRDGGLTFDAHLVPTGDDSYRAYRFPWSARPSGSPGVAASVSGANTTVLASWNGATDVAQWQVLAGPDPSALAPVANTPPSGFETAIQVAGTPQYVAVRALDSGGNVLGTSAPVKP